MHKKHQKTSFVEYSGAHIFTRCSYFNTLCKSIHLLSSFVVDLFFFFFFNFVSVVLFLRMASIEFWIP